MAKVKAGESLASIAGTKKDSLIKAIVDFQTKTIDDALAAGKITGDQATKLKSKLLERTTSMVERAKGLGKGFGLEFRGGKGHGKGPRS
jgi:polyhydroxyalkanoate synthesis regulator phasin